MSNPSTEDTVQAMPVEPAQAPTAEAKPTSASGAATGDSPVAPRPLPKAAREVLRLARERPLQALAAGAAATALIEVEFALGVLAGIGATALFATRTGTDARHEVLEVSKRAWCWTRGALAAKGRQPSSEPAQH